MTDSPAIHEMSPGQFLSVPFGTYEIVLSVWKNRLEGAKLDELGCASCHLKVTPAGKSWRDTNRYARWADMGWAHAHAVGIILISDRMKKECMRTPRRAFLSHFPLLPISVRRSVYDDLEDARDAEKNITPESGNRKGARYRSANTTRFVVLMQNESQSQLSTRGYLEEMVIKDTL